MPVVFGHIMIKQYQTLYKYCAFCLAENLMIYIILFIIIHVLKYTSLMSNLILNNFKLIIVILYTGHIWVSQSYEINLPLNDYY